jgi:hypothetical protein
MTPSVPISPSIIRITKKISPFRSKSGTPPARSVLIQLPPPPGGAFYRVDGLSAFIVFDLTRGAKSLSARFAMEGGRCPTAIPEKDSGELSVYIIRD